MLKTKNNRNDFIMFKSHKEKIAYKQGIKKGRAGGRVWKGRDDPPYIKSSTSGKYKSDKYKDKHESAKLWDDWFNATVALERYKEKNKKGMQK